MDQVSQVQTFPLICITPTFPADLKTFLSAAHKKLRLCGLNPPRENIKETEGDAEVEMPQTGGDLVPGLGEGSVGE